MGCFLGFYLDFWYVLFMFYVRRVSCWGGTRLGVFWGGAHLVGLVGGIGAGRSVVSDV